MSKARLTMVGGTLALVILVLIGWFLVLSPQMAKAGEIKEQIEVTDTQNTGLRTQIAKIEQQEAGLAEQRAFAAALASRFPATAAQAEMFSQIRTAAAKAGIGESALTALTPSVPQGGTGAATGNGPVTLPGTGVKGVASLQVGMSVTGTYTQMTKFLSTLESMPRAYLIDSISMGPGGEGSAYTLTITGSMFALQAPVDPDDAAKVPAPSAPTSPTAPAPGTAPAGGAPSPAPSLSRVPGAPNVPDPGAEAPAS
jgi:Tfp pilus assembly protein PilO